MKHCLSVLLCGACLLAIDPARAQDCIITPINFNSHVAELSGEMTVKAGRGCGMNVSGITGAINETSITQMPKVGKAGVRGNTAIYIAKPGYQGPDEFAYVHVGTDQYGGPMRVSIRRRITVVP